MDFVLNSSCVCYTYIFIISLFFFNLTILAMPCLTPKDLYNLFFLPFRLFLSYTRNQWVLDQKFHHPPCFYKGMKCHLSYTLVAPKRSIKNWLLNIINCIRSLALLPLATNITNLHISPPELSNRVLRSTVLLISLSFSIHILSASYQR